MYGLRVWEGLYASYSMCDLCANIYGTIPKYYLITLGKVKVGLDNFDIKISWKFYVQHFFKPIPIKKKACKSIKLHLGYRKMKFWHSLNKFRSNPKNLSQFGWKSCIWTPQPPAVSLILNYNFRPSIKKRLVPLFVQHLLPLPLWLWGKSPVSDMSSHLQPLEGDNW